jgi:hypothetical protein
MADKFIKKEEPVLHNTVLDIVKVEDKAVIVKVQGWRMRVYFDKDAKKGSFHEGMKIGVKHYGNINNPHEIKFLKLK